MTSIAIRTIPFTGTCRSFEHPMKEWETDQDDKDRPETD
jgi:hypothetical protein